MFATNGIQLADKDFCTRMIELGVVNSIVFSIHGNTAELHDYLVDHVGAFLAIENGIKNLKNL
jgi:MoaA/NifB/PqqE/SkfB family radical SAM enzyme